MVSRPPPYLNFIMVPMMASIFALKCDTNTALLNVAMFLVWLANLLVVVVWLIDKWNETSSVSEN